MLLSPAKRETSMWNIPGSISVFSQSIRSFVHQWLWFKEMGWIVQFRWIKQNHATELIRYAHLIICDTWVQLRSRPAIHTQAFPGSKYISTHCICWSPTSLHITTNPVEANQWASSSTSSANKFAKTGHILLQSFNASAIELSIVYFFNFFLRVWTFAGQF